MSQSLWLCKKSIRSQECVFILDTSLERKTVSSLIVRLLSELAAFCSTSLVRARYFTFDEWFVAINNGSFIELILKMNLATVFMSKSSIVANFHKFIHLNVFLRVPFFFQVFNQNFSKRVNLTMYSGNESFLRKQEQRASSPPLYITPVSRFNWYLVFCLDFRTGPHTKLLQNTVLMVEIVISQSESRRMFGQPNLLLYRPHHSWISTQNGCQLIRTIKSRAVLIWLIQTVDQILETPLKIIHTTH